MSMKPDADKLVTGKFRYTLFQKVSDTTITIRGLWLLILFDLLAIFAFLFVDQGTDVLLSIAEDAANQFRIIPLFWLLVTLFFWSIAAEFCSRFIIYLSDNSGRSLAKVRVDYRKHLQKVIARVSLFFPLVLMILAFCKAWFSNHKDFYTPSINLAFGLIILLLCFLGLLLYWLYVGNGIVKAAQKYQSLQWLAISPREDQWVRKLYGILNDVRVDIPDIYTNMEGSAYNGPDLPRETTLPNGMTLPKEFLAYNNNPRQDNNLYIWMFKIPRSFYKCLFRQLFVLSVLAFLFIITFAFIVEVKAYMLFGATAMICLAFACWQIIYTGLHYLDKVQSKFPFRFFLMVMFLITTFFNKDHQVRILNEAAVDKRPQLTQHFDDWFHYLQADTLRRNIADRTYRDGLKKDTVPVVFIAAEGGALRTGAFTAMILAKLADQYPSFSKYIYCYSGVSGGTLGTNFFNAVYLNRKINSDTVSFASATETFFKTDFLAAVTGKLVFGEIINYFIPFHINRLDRAIALEEAWEDGWHQIDKEKNVLAGSFNQTVNNRLPAVFINTTEVETGLQCIWSNTIIDSLPLSKQRDVSRRVKTDIAYSTAINLSTRFPLISPGAAIYDKQNRIRRHFIDGGYYENTGAETLLEVMKALKLNNKPIKPYVLQFNFGDDDTTIKSKSVKAFSEVMEVVGGIYNTRSGRSNVAQYYLQQYVKELNGAFISLYLPLNTRKFPMNWILSNTAVTRLNKALEQMVIKNPSDTSDLKDKRELRKLFVYRQ
ncbi:hypothetical protein OCK74_12540 [Chitinophagaceae bacterium LB-8]|uniref:PNPLA domain-containing protein n=1 Tax=Paraflavisolibacter caeni TaxID=2982496 RepID=A0A9X3BHN0_9BACT|nr:hypothetical protein [Paraflavisolibacter caeni]MCU7549952.1 hypothetical protein [Paraflavisolibacter caeni]